MDKISQIDIKQKLEQFIMEEFSVSQEALAENPSLIDGGWLDSYSVVNLAMFIETSFAIEILPEELNPQNLDTIDAISEFIQSKIA